MTARRRTPGRTDAAGGEDDCGRWLSSRTSRSDEPDAAADTAEVGWLYVSPDRISEGVGSGLLAQAISRAADQGFVEATLWVYADNERARRFYENAGWQLDGSEQRRQRGDTRPLGLRYRITLPSR